MSDLHSSPSNDPHSDPQDSRSSHVPDSPQNAFTQHVLPFLLKIATPFRYYYDERNRLWLNFAAQFSLPAIEARRGQEVMLPAWDRNAGNWLVEFEDRCHACGQSTSEPPMVAERTVGDMQSVFWSPVIGLGFGLLLRVFWLGNWILPASVLAGMLAGWVSRSQWRVRMHVNSCADHSAAPLPELRVFESDLYVKFGSREAKTAYLQQHRTERSEVQVNLESPIAGLSDSLKQKEKRQRAETTKRLKAQALAGPSASEADRRQARRRSETIPKPIRFPESTYILCRSWLRGLRVFDSDRNEVARMRTCIRFWKNSISFRLSAPPRNQPYLEIRSLSMRTKLQGSAFELRTSKGEVGKLVNVYREGKLASVDLVYLGRWIRYAVPVDVEKIKQEQRMEGCGKSLANLVVYLGGGGLAFLLMGWFALLLLPFLLVFAKWNRSGIAMAFTQDDEVVAHLDTKSWPPNKWLLTRTTEQGDLEVCLILAAMAAMNQVGSFEEPCEISSNGLK